MSWVIGAGGGQVSTVQSGLKPFTRISPDGGQSITDTSNIIIPASTIQGVLDGSVPRIVTFSVVEGQSNFFLAPGEPVILTANNEVWALQVEGGFNNPSFQISGQFYHAACKSGLTSIVHIYVSE